MSRNVSKQWENNSNLIKRFWSKVDIKGEDDCWEWMACKNPKGYGLFQTYSKEQLTHRIAWTLINGNIENGTCILHHCDNRPCCNPKHLFKGTKKDNVMDMIAKGRGQRGILHYNARLTEEQVIAIRVMFQANISMAELARIYKVIRQHIYMIVKEKYGSIFNKRVVLS